MQASFKPFEPEVLARFEQAGVSDLDEDADCAGGACPIR